MSATDDLVAFLTARLDEDERAANACADEGSVGLPAQLLYDVGFPATTEHIERHGPERVLRDVAAKRLIVDLCTHNLEFEDHGWSVADPVLRHLASAYDDHPDYRAEWRP